jgi:hypothetical protein
VDEEPPGKTDMSHDLHKELGLMFHVKAEIMKALIEATQR